MSSSSPKHLPVGGEEEGMIKNEFFQPMSPSSHCIHSQFLSLSILVVTGSEIPIVASKVRETIQNHLLTTNTRFSSVVVTGKNGEPWWKEVDVKIENHLKVPVFPPGLSKEDYTKHLKEYLENVAVVELPKTKPLWEMHVFNYPTLDAVGTIALKMHHAHGDGFSLMGALFSCLKRADNPSLPLTFPQPPPASLKRSSKTTFFKGVKEVVNGCWYSISDFTWSLLKATVAEDDQTAIRSKNPGLESMTKEINSVLFSLDDLRLIKSKTKGSVNDVVVGIIFYAIHLYAKAMDSAAPGLRRTALVLLNTRMLNGYRSIDDMLEKNLWGNHFSFIHLPIPSYSHEANVDPLKFIFTAKDVIQRNRNSMGVYLNSTLLRIVGHFKGTEAISQYLNSTLANTSIAITNIVGPVEKMVIAEHPINYIYFTVTGVPQSLVFTIMSYMGNLRIVATTEKDFIDSQLLVSCMKEGFDNIFETAKKL